MPESISEWFDKADSKSKLLSSVRSLNDERYNWSLAKLSIPEDKDAVTFTSTLRDEESLYKSTKVDVERLIRRLVHQISDDPLQSKAASELHLAAASFESWKSDRQSTTSRKACSGLQRTLSNIGEFLKGFSGVAEIVKAADQQFGGLAYGTVSLLVTVAVNKQAREETLEEALEELTYAFPHLEILQTLRKTDSLRLLIVQVFELVVCFCREAIDYFAQRLHRIAKAFSPLRLKTLSRLRMKLSEIQKECAFMMLEELGDARRQLREVQTQLRRIEDTGDDTNSRIRESQAWAIRSSAQDTESYMLDLKKVLGLTRFENVSSHAVARYKTLLANEFSNHRKRRRSARQLSQEMLKEDSFYSGWTEKTESTVWTLAGKNWLEDASIQLNWLSYASVFIIEWTRKPICLLSFFCQIDYTANRRKRRSFPEIICSFIYQLVEQYPEHVRPRLDDVSDTLESSKWKDEDCSIAFDAMIEYLASLLTAFEQGTEIVIVIDRLDQCRWSDDPEDDASRLIQAVGSLRDLVAHSDLKHLHIKVLLVMDQGPARNVTAILEWAKGRGLEWKTDWDQEADE